MGKPRPFRATVYLPGHQEDGAPVVVANVSACTEGGLARALAKWLEDGYVAVGYEELTLPLDD